MQLQAIVANSDWRHGLKFDCNEEATLVPDKLQFELHLAMISSSGAVITLICNH